MKPVLLLVWCLTWCIMFTVGVIGTQAINPDVTTDFACFAIVNGIIGAFGIYKWMDYSIRLKMKGEE